MIKEGGGMVGEGSHGGGDPHKIYHDIYEQTHIGMNKDILIGLHTLHSTDCCHTEYVSSNTVRLRLFC